MAHLTYYGSFLGATNERNDAELPKNVPYELASESNVGKTPPPEEKRCREFGEPPVPSLVHLCNVIPNVGYSTRFRGDMRFDTIQGARRLLDTQFGSVRETTTAVSSGPPRDTPPRQTGQDLPDNSPKCVKFT